VPATPALAVDVLLPATAGDKSGCAAVCSGAQRRACDIGATLQDGVGENAERAFVDLVDFLRSVEQPANFQQGV
jgi:hypothetical protein